MTTTVSELKPSSASRSERERFGDILALQRAAFLHDGPPSLTKRRSDLKKFKAAMLARRSAIEEAINTTSAIAHATRRQSWKSWASSRVLITSCAISVASFARPAATSP